MNPLKKFIYELQEITILVWQAFLGLFKRPFYASETFQQMDIIGVGSLTIVLLTGFFTGGVSTIQGYPTLSFYGQESSLGYYVAFALIRELGPVLTALMVTGRVGSAISAELGSMVVSQQIEAMRALGTNPIRKLVAPRILALVITLPLLTVTADVFGIIGGGFVANNLYGLPYNLYVNSVRNGITIEDLLGGVIKPIVFGLIIGAIACRKGLATEGGTAGVGRSTTDAVVLASILVIIADFFLARGLQFFFGTGAI